MEKEKYFILMNYYKFFVHNTSAEQLTAKIYLEIGEKL